MSTRVFGRGDASGRPWVTSEDEDYRAVGADASDEVSNSIQI